MYTCKYCGKELKNKSGVTSHEMYYCKENPDVKKINSYKEHKKVACKNCGKLIDVACIKRHENSCINGYANKEQCHLDHDDLFCKYCGKEYKNKNSLAQHEIRCKENLDRINCDYFPKYIRNYRKGKTKENCLDILKQANSLKEKYSNGYVHSNTGYGYGFKYGRYKGFWCDSSWELAFLLYHLDNNIKIERNDDPFLYKIEDGSIHTYYPDFIVDNVYYEIKGRFDDKTLLKIESVKNSNKVIKLLDYDLIKPYLNYAIEKYGYNFYDLYDNNFPSWKTKNLVDK